MPSRPGGPDIQLHSHRHSCPIWLNIRHSRATNLCIRPARQPRIVPSPARTYTQAAPSRTPTVPTHLIEFVRRERERREREENPAATQSVGEMVMPMYPRKFQSNSATGSEITGKLTNFSADPTQSLTAEDIDQINLLDDIEREILRFSQNGGLSPVTI